MNKVYLLLIVVLTAMLSLNIVSAGCIGPECDQKSSSNYIGLVSFEKNPVTTNLGVNINFLGLEKNDQNWISVVEYPKNPENIPAKKTGLGRYYVINSGFIQNEFSSTIEFEYSDEEIAGLEESSLDVYYLTDQGWKLGDASIDFTTNKLILKTDQFSMFTILGEPKYMHSSQRNYPSSSIKNDEAENNYCTNTESCKPNEIPEFTTIGLGAAVVLVAGFLIIMRKN